MVQDTPSTVLEVEMAWVDFFKGASGRGFAIGVAAGALAPVVLPVIASAAKPLARAALKAGIMAYEKGRETLEEVNEIIDDVVAEVRADLEARSTGVEDEEDDRQMPPGEVAPPENEVSQRRR
jgi:hypothetical protein